MFSLPYLTGPASSPPSRTRLGWGEPGAPAHPCSQSAGSPRTQRTRGCGGPPPTSQAGRLRPRDPGCLLFFMLFEKAGETSRPPILRRPGSHGAQAPWDGGQGSDPGGDGEGAVRNPVWGWAPCCAVGYPQAVPAPPLAGARVQPDKDRLLFCVKKSIIPSDVPVIGEVHSTSWRGRRGVGRARAPEPGATRPARPLPSWLVGPIHGGLQAQGTACPPPCPPPMPPLCRWEAGARGEPLGLCASRGQGR